MSEPRPARVRVTGPPRRRRTTPPGPPGTETPLGSLYAGSLVRAQRAAAVRALVLLVVTVGALPLVFHLVPRLAEVELWGVPLAWPVVGVATYPLLLLLGWRHLRRAERIERDYLDLVRLDHGPGEQEP